MGIWEILGQVGEVFGFLGGDDLVEFLEDSFDLRESFVLDLGLVEVAVQEVAHHDGVLDLDDQVLLGFLGSEDEKEQLEVLDG